MPPPRLPPRWRLHLIPRGSRAAAHAPPSLLASSSGISPPHAGSPPLPAPPPLGPSSPRHPSPSPACSGSAQARRLGHGWPPPTLPRVDGMAHRRGRPPTRRDGVVTPRVPAWARRLSHATRNGRSWAARGVYWTAWGDGFSFFFMFNKRARISSVDDMSSADNCWTPMLRFFFGVGSWTDEGDFHAPARGPTPRIVVPTRTLLQSQHRLGQPPARTGAEADPGQGPRTTCVLCLPWLYCSCFLSFIIAVHLHAEIGSAQNLWVFRKHLIVTCSWFTLYMCYAQCRHRL